MERAKLLAQHQICWLGLVVNLSPSYPNDAPDVHLGDHLSGEEEGHAKVNAEGHVHEYRVEVEGLRGVHTDRDDAQQGTHPQYAPHPMLVDPFNVGIVVKVLIRTIVGERKVIHSHALFPSQHDGSWS